MSGDHPASTRGQSNQSPILDRCCQTIQETRLPFLKEFDKYGAFCPMPVKRPVWSPSLVQGRYLLLALVWLIPDRRIEKALASPGSPAG